MNHKWELFKHWKNKAFLGVAGMAAIVWGWPVVVAAGIIEAIVLTVGPDIRPVRQALEAAGKGNQRTVQRTYLVNQLWNLSPRREGGFLSWFTDSEVTYSGGNGLKEARTFYNLLAKVDELREVRGVNADAITEPEIDRIDEAINHWLSLLNKAKSLQVKLDKLDKAQLRQDFQEISQQRETADRSTQIVIANRLAVLKKKVAAIPELEKRLGTAKANAESLVIQIEAQHQKAMTAGAADAEAALDLDFLDSDFDVLSDDFSLASIHTTGSAADKMWADVAEGLGLEKAEARPLKTAAEPEGPPPVPAVELEATGRSGRGHRVRGLAEARNRLEGHSRVRGGLFDFDDE